MPPPAETLPATEQELDAFLAAFEAGTLPKERFSHAGHLLAGACYVHRMEESAAIDHMRICVRRFNEAVGGRNTETSGYHETITRFWLEIVRAYIAALPAGLTPVDVTRRVVEEFAPKRDLFRDYYDFDVLKSREARAVWIPPNQSPGVTSIFPTPSA